MHDRKIFFINKKAIDFDDILSGMGWSFKALTICLLNKKQPVVV